MTSLRFWRHPPALVFGLQALVLGLALYATGRMRPEIVPDTASYTDFVWSPCSAALSQMRTAGYPCFLAVCRRLGADWSAVPAAQYLVHVLAVGLFWQALRKWFAAEWPALVCASTLFYANVVWRYVHVVAADCLAASLAVLCVAALLALVREPKRRSLWLAVTGITLATYQVRPAYLFLVPLVPLLGWMLAALEHLCHRSQGSGSGLAWRLGLASLVPLLLFSAGRWFVVGEFGLVSFAGYNFAGVVGQFLSPETADHLPADLVPLARAALERRRELAAREPSFSADVTLSYMAIEKRFDASTWQVFAPAAREVYAGEPVQMNTGLTRLSLATIRLRPRYYAVWLGKAFFRAVYMIGSELVINPVYFGLLAVLTALQWRYAVQWTRRDFRPLAIDRDHVLRFHTLFAIALAFSGFKVLLVIATTPPLGRFMDAAGVFWPTVIGAMLAHRMAALRELR